jgi:ribose 1,5-bisphosphate isomerase
MILPLDSLIVLKAVKKIAKDIRALKIQGATNVAIQAVKAICSDLSDLDNVEKAHVEKSLKKGRKALVETRETEPMMRNGLRYIESRINEEEWEKKEEFLNIVKDTEDTILDLFGETKKRLTEIGTRRILDGITILSHCHSSSVTETLLKAKEKGVAFKVIITETRPKYQGRITAKELTDAEIDTTMIVDSAARYFMKEADLVMVGCDAITSEGNVINKIGTSQVASAAHEARIPFYVLTTLLKFDPVTIHGEFEVIEERSTNEVWENPPEKLKIRNPAFDITKRGYIHGIISEVGIISPHSILDAVNREYKWIVKRI